MARQDTKPAPLGELAQARGFNIGAAVNVRALRGDPDYGPVLAREFNALTTENALKFAPLRPTREGYRFDRADALIEFAHQHDMRVRGHTLVWHNQVPPWVARGSFSRAEWTALLEDHIATVVGRYRDQIWAWDVVNEGVLAKGGLRDTLWHRNIGDNYIEQVFRWAHEADPKAKLFYNDFGAEGMNAKSYAVYCMVRDLLERDVLISGSEMSIE